MYHTKSEAFLFTSNPIGLLLSLEGKSKRSQESRTEGQGCILFWVFICFKKKGGGINSVTQAGHSPALTSQVLDSCFHHNAGLFLCPSGSSHLFGGRSLGSKPRTFCPCWSNTLQLSISSTWSSTWPLRLTMYSTSVY